MANNTENNQLMIPYIAHESAMDRLERTNKRMFIVIIGLILAFLLSNAMWLYNWMQYDYVDTFEVDVESDGDGIANYIGDDGDINNGGTGTSTPHQKHHISGGIQIISAFINFLYIIILRKCIT